MSTTADDLAAAVVKALGGNMIHAELPENLASQVRDAARNGTRVEVHSLITLVPMSPSIVYTILPSGGIGIELRDVNGAHVWQGTLRPRCSGS